MTSAEEMAERLARKGPLCLRAMKEIYYKCCEMDNQGAFGVNRASVYPGDEL